jgi:hypothetical protein
MDCGKVAVFINDRSIWSQATPAADQQRGLARLGAVGFAREEASSPSAVCEIGQYMDRVPIFAQYNYAYEVLIRHRRPVTSVTNESDFAEKAVESGRFHLGRSTAVRPRYRAGCTVK